MISSVTSSSAPFNPKAFCGALADSLTKRFLKQQEISNIHIPRLLLESMQQLASYIYHRKKMNEIVSNLRGISLLPECWDVMKKKTHDPPLTAWVALQSC